MYISGMYRVCRRAIRLFAASYKYDNVQYTHETIYIITFRPTLQSTTSTVDSESEIETRVELKL